MIAKLIFHQTQFQSLLKHRDCKRNLTKYSQRALEGRVNGVSAQLEDLSGDQRSELDIREPFNTDQFIKTYLYQKNGINERILGQFGTKSKNGQFGTGQFGTKS